METIPDDPQRLLDPQLSSVGEPVGGRKGLVVNEELVDEFLKKSRYVPPLVLPPHLFPTPDSGGNLSDIAFPNTASLVDQSMKDQLELAAEEVGCFEIVSHGVLDELPVSLRLAMIEFFCLPLDRKLMVARNKLNMQSGYEEVLSDDSPIRETFLWNEEEDNKLSDAIRKVYSTSHRSPFRLFASWKR